MKADSLRKYSGHAPWCEGELQTCQAFITILEDQVDCMDIVTSFSGNLKGLFFAPSKVLFIAFIENLLQNVKKDVQAENVIFSLNTTS